MGYSIQHDHKFWDERFGRPECAENYHYYGYEYLDDLSCMPSARVILGDWPHTEALIDAVSRKLTALGWEGTGDFQMLWFPPFVGVGPHDYFGAYALHVKQDDDGISWIASPIALPFHRLFQRDPAKYPPPDPEPIKAKLRRMWSEIPEVDD